MNRLARIFGLIFLACLASCQPGPKKMTIGYVQITEDPVLDAAKNGVFRALADSGFIDGVNIQILDKNAQGDLAMISMILQSLVSRNVDLIITNSTPCMMAAAQSVRDIPVVFTVAFGPEQVGMKTVPGNLYGVFDPLLAVEFVDLMAECLPGIQRVGIPYNNAEPNAEYSVGVLSREFAKRGFTLVTAPVTSSNDILQAGQYLAGQHIDAMVVAADNTVYLGLPILAKLAAEQKIPLFVADPLQAEKGAAFGFGVNYDQWGYLSGLKAVEIMNKRVPVSKISPIEKYDLIINKKTCAALELTVPESVTARAQRIIE
jgi:putative ABC transport system substrate-binding protein